MFHFKRESKVYLVYAGNQYRLDIGDIRFAQNFNEIQYSNKSIQSELMFWQSSLYQATPASWNIRIPLLQESDLKVLFNRVLDYKPFDIYVDTGKSIFKIEYAVVTNGIFIITRNRTLQMETSGQASRISKVTSIPGAVKARSSNRTYAKIDVLNVTMDGVEDLTHFTAFTVEIQNRVQWIPYNALDHGLVAIDGNSVQFPQEYVVTDRTVAGTIERHKVEGHTFSRDTNLLIEAGDLNNGDFFGVRFNLPNVSFTARLGTSMVFTEAFDWRLTYNPDYLGEIIEYVTDLTAGGSIEAAILDYLDNPILDSNDQPILESF